jgi:hypothetical protein
MEQFDFWVIINDERKENFEKLFGTNRVPIESPVPVRANTPQGEKIFYQLNMRFLTPERKERVVEDLSKKFHLTKEFVLENLPKIGVPIEDKGVDLEIPFRLHRSFLI